MIEPTRRWRPSWQVVTVVIVLVILGLWKLTSGISGTPDAIEDEPTVPSVVLTGDDQIALDEDWVRVDLPGRSALRDVWEVGGTWFATGWDDADQQTVVWRSPDGAVWRPLPAEEDQFDQSVIHDMIGFDGLVIAVGVRIVDDSTSSDDTDASRTIPAVWRSADGESFFLVGGTAVEFWGESSGEPNAGGFTSIEAFGEGLIVGGWEGQADLLTGAGPTRGSVWQSTDAVTYSHLVVSDDALGVDRAVVWALVSDGGTFVAAGEEAGTASVWVSADGASWEHVVASDEPDTSAIAAAPGPSGSVVLEVLDSQDSQTPVTVRLWSATTGSYVAVAPSGLEGAEVADIGVGTFGMIAVGSTRSSDEVSTGAIWSSPNGVQWAEVEAEEIPSASRLASIVVGEQAIVAVGQLHDQPSIWVRLFEQDDEAVVGVGSLFPPPTWSTVFQQEEATGIAPTSVLRAGDFLYGLGSEEWLWRSRDGDVWTLQDFESAGLGDADRLLQIVSAESGWVALGDGEGGRLWFSPDGETWQRTEQPPTCCAAAVFREEDGFVALVRDSLTATWLRSSTEDGLVWETEETPLVLPVTTVDHLASIGPLGLLWGEPVAPGASSVWASVDGASWFPVGTEQGLNGVLWTRVWDLGGQVVAAGVLRDEPVLFRTTDGVDWQSLALPEFESEELLVIDVGDFGDGLAVLVSNPQGSTRLLTFTGIGTQDEVPLGIASGFTGRWSILVPNDVSLRMAGSDHGRMTIWEWIPAP